MKKLKLNLSLMYVYAVPHKFVSMPQNLQYVEPFCHSFRMEVAIFTLLHEM